MSKEYLKENGHFTVLIIQTEAKKSSKGDDMLVVTFKDINSGKEINGYYVPKHEFMAKRLQQLKTAIGVGPMAKKEDMLGKKCVIGVRQQEVKPGKEKINDKTGKPYPPSFEVFEYFPIQDEVALAKEVFGNNDLPF